MAHEDLPPKPTLPPNGPGSSSSSGVWQAPSAEELQSQLPQYEVLKLIGRGGMGAVYRARQKSLKRLVAIKILPLASSDDELNFAERFKNEAFAMARLNHTGIVNVHDAGETADGLLYFVMEHVEGRDLAHEIADRAPLPQQEVRSVALQVCEALGYLHGNGVIHRDIKPANILLDAQGKAKVADFGLARLEGPLASGLLTRTGTSLGTADFMAPECRRAAASVDHRADLFSLGVTLYQMLTGELPHGMFKLPSQMLPEIDEGFDGIICKALEPKPEDRYQSAQEMRDDLEAIGVAVSHVEKVMAPPEKKPARSWLIVGGIAALLAVSAWVIVRVKGKPSQSSEAPVVVAHPSSAPVSKLSSTLPPNQWIKLPDTQEAITRSGVKGLVVKDGWMRMSNPVEGHVDLLTLAGETGSTHVQNLSLRMTVRPPTNRQFPLTFEMRSRDGFLHAFNLFSDQVTLMRIVKQSPDAKTEHTLLGEVMLPPSQDADGTLKIECGIKWDLITFSVDGNKVLEVTDESLRGVGRFFLGSASESEGAVLKDVSIKLLDQGRSVDLLEIVEVKRDALAGEWSRSDAELSVKEESSIATLQNSPRLQLPYQPPEEYDFEVEFTPESGDKNVYQLLSAQGRQFAWVMDAGTDAGKKAGFENIDGKGIIGRTIGSKMRQHFLINGKRHHSKVEVRKTGVRGFLDDELLATWGTGVDSFKSLDIPPARALHDAHHLGIAVTDRALTIHKIEVREITGTGKIDGIEAPTPVHTFKGHRYQFVAGDLNWGDAKVEAEKMGGHLAAITSAEEGDQAWRAFADHLPRQPTGSSWRRGWWLGGSQPALENPWQWLTNEPMTYTKWGTQDPMPTTNPPRSLWMADDNSDAHDWKWSAQRSIFKGGFLVEWDSEK